MKRSIVATALVALIFSSVALAQPGHGKGHGRGNSSDYDDSYDRDTRGGIVFSRSDRDRITDCLTNNTQGLPPGLAKRDRLPPGLEKHLQRNGQLPPGLQKKVQPLPYACEVRLPRLPRGVTRVVLGNYVILRDIHERILDLIELNRRR
jgi:hypothetical protein